MVASFFVALLQLQGNFSLSKMVASLFVVLQNFLEASLSTLLAVYWIPFFELAFVLQNSIAPFYVVILLGSSSSPSRGSANTSAHCSSPNGLIFSIEMEMEVGHGYQLFYQEFACNNLVDRTCRSNLNIFPVVE